MKIMNNVKKTFKLKRPGFGLSSAIKQWGALGKYSWDFCILLSIGLDLWFSKFNDFNKRLVKRQTPQPYSQPTKFEFLEVGMRICSFLQVILIWMFKQYILENTLLKDLFTNFLKIHKILIPWLGQVEFSTSFPKKLPNPSYLPFMDMET